jgi:hypothetical protein
MPDEIIEKSKRERKEIYIYIYIYKLKEKKKGKKEDVGQFSSGSENPRKINETMHCEARLVIIPYRQHLLRRP